MIVYPLGDLSHNQQVLAGLEILRSRSEVDFKYDYNGLIHYNINTSGLYEFSPIFQTVIVKHDDVGDVVFDVNDGDIFFPDIYARCFMYFKRSYSPTVHGTLPKMKPLGLNYEARSPASCAIAAVYRALRLSRSPQTLARGLCRALHLPRPHIVEPARPSLTIPNCKHARVLFLTRTLDPHQFASNEDEFQEIVALNNMRADCVRLLREAFGDRCTGGLVRNAHAGDNFPDCLVPEHLPTDRKSFLDMVEQHQICIATTGLWGSTGWKFAEYLAKGRAIVSEKMCYAVPGPFDDEINYLSFATGEECVARCGELLNDEVRLRRMMVANRAYFRNYVAPEAIVRNAFDTVAAAANLGMEASSPPEITNPAALAPSNT